MSCSFTFSSLEGQIGAGANDRDSLTTEYSQEPDDTYRDCQYGTCVWHALSYGQ